MHFSGLLPALTLSTFLHYSLNSAKSNISYPFPYTLGPDFSTSQSCLFCPIDPRQDQLRPEQQQKWNGKRGSVSKGKETTAAQPTNTPHGVSRDVPAPKPCTNRQVHSWNQELTHPLCLSMDPGRSGQDSPVLVRGAQQAPV